MSAGWQFWIDRGGTFTDVVGLSPAGDLRTAKLLSENPRRYRDAALQGIRELLGLDAEGDLRSAPLDAVKMGTTVATNALLERQGARTLLLITRGFSDALRIGYQNRPRLFDLDIRLPELLYEEVAEVEERLDAAGELVTPLDEGRARAALKSAYDRGIRSVAIALMHSYTNPVHEERLAALAREIGFEQVSVSSRASPLVKLVGRGDTTVADAYLSPVLGRYVNQVESELGDTRLLFMQSNGGLSEAHLFQGKDAILSGPAGGVVGAVRTAELAGFDRLIGFDMGGTSTDVCHYDGELERVFDSVVAGTRIRAPMMHIHTVAAGGGSVVRLKSDRFQVGPDSAGADPGPACYGRGGPLTVTDCNVMTGKIIPDHFPRVFGEDGASPLDAGVVREKFAETAALTGRSPEAAAEGFLAVAVENMARAIKRISLERGYDVSRYTLVCFGGAGGQHACLVADALGIERVMIHPLAGVLSALGMGLADMREIREQSVELPFEDAALDRVEQVFARLESEALPAVEGHGRAPFVERRVHLRYQGTDTPLVVAFGTLEEMQTAFDSAHRQRFGFIDPDRPLVFDSLSVEAVARSDAPDLKAALASGEGAGGEETRDVFMAGQWRKTRILRREGLSAGTIVPGPAILSEPHGTNVVEPGWQAEITARGDLVLQKIGAAGKDRIGTGVDPVRLEIFNNLFMSIAEQMGAVIENTSHSVNMKERLDFSCAVFDTKGRLIANAPHIPVHLGSMGDSVRTVMRLNPDMAEGDVFVLNAPYNGGTHLPDITVVTPVFMEGEPLFYVATRGHHADIGGITPGSVPPSSTHIDEEGVLIDNVKLASKGRFLEDEMRRVLASGTYPARNPDQNIADLKAQMAANEKGARELKRMIGQFGLDVVRAYMSHVRDNAAEAVRGVIDSLGDGTFSLEMDCGAVIEVNVKVDREARTARIDFTGTSAQMDNNFNAPLSITTAATLYVFRCLVGSDIPLNEGCLEPLEITVPEASLLNPVYPAAVVAGNVETSQCLVNALFGALKACAGAQGTMNNLTFGNDRYQYYETLAGGMGAGPKSGDGGFDGASAVQTHMTNSRLTDPEILEFRYPVRVEEFSLRRGSGGRGKWTGGDGVVRRLLFLEPMSASILSNNRIHSPFGLDGGQPGKAGRNAVQRGGGAVETLGSCAETDVAAGDILIIETPGGGGYGRE